MVSSAALRGWRPQGHRSSNLRFRTTNKTNDFRPFRRLHLIGAAVLELIWFHYFCIGKTVRNGGQARQAARPDHHTRVTRCDQVVRVCGLLVALLAPAPAHVHAQGLDLPTVTFAASATTDWVTTYRNLNTPARISPDGRFRTEFYEANPLIGWAADRPALMFTVAAGLDATGVYAWHRLTERHRKIRAIGLYAAAAARFALAYRNHQRREQFLRER